MVLLLGGAGSRNLQYWLKDITNEGWWIIKNCFEKLTGH